MAAVLSGDARHADRIAQLDAARRRARHWRYLRYGLIALLVGWSVEAIVVGDTDWSRITWNGVLTAAARFIDFDAGVLKTLWEPTLETLLMATLATILGAFLAIPVAWLGASNISPLGRATYSFGRTLMTISRSVHEVVWAWCSSPRLAWARSPVCWQWRCAQSASSARPWPRRSRTSTRAPWKRCARWVRTAFRC